MRSIPRRSSVLSRLTRVALGAALCVPLLGCPDLPDGPRYMGAGHTTPQQGGTLKLSESTRVRTLDPHIAFDTVSGAVLEMLFDGLYQYNREMQLEPLVAESLPEYAPDGLSLSFTLKQGLRFQNGREITADDVVWSLERMLAPTTFSPGVTYYAAMRGVAEYRAGKAAHVSGLKAVDRYRISIELTEADQSFSHVLAMRFAAPVPREEVERLGARFGKHPSGNGPYRLATWDPGVRLVLEPNPHYQGKKPYLERVVIEEGIGRDIAFLRFRNGEVDIVDSVSPADRALLIESPKWAPYTEISPAVDVFGLVMNCELAPFDNVHVRRAVAFAIDRQRWAKARSGGLLPTGQIVPPQLPGYDAELPHRQQFDLARAKEEMKLAGYPNGLPKPVTLWITEGGSARIYAQLAQADLEKIGVKLHVKMVSFPVYLEAAATRKTTQLVSAGWMMDYPDASNFLGLLHSNARAERESTNKAFYSNPALDSLLDKGRVELDPTKRAAYYREANDIAAHDAPWAFFSNSLVPHAWQPYVKGYHPHPAYPLSIRGVWLDLPRKRVSLLKQALLPFSRPETYAVRGAP